MNDIVIRRCTLRVVRHGGWSWGPNRRALLSRVTAELPRLIAERLSELLGDADGEIAEPVKVRLSLRAGQLLRDDEWASAVRQGLQAESIPMPAARGPSHAVQADGRLPREAEALDSVMREPGDDAARAAPLATPTRLLLAWRTRRELWQRLQGFSTSALELWLEALLHDMRAASTARAGEDGLRRECARIRETLPPQNEDVLECARARLAIAVEIAARYPSQIDGDVLRRALDRSVASAPSAASAADNATSARAPMAAAHRHARGARISTAPARMQAPPPGRPVGAHAKDVRLCSVLPFVVLGVLHRLGWLDVAAAAFQALRDPDHGSRYATALAHKLLPPPDRGWHRSEDALLTAAAFAGRRAPASPLELSRFCRMAGDALSPMDDFISSVLAQGHDLQCPLLITRVDTRYPSRWLLLDADGGLPVTWANDEPTLHAHVRRFGPCIVLVSTAAASPSLTHAFARDGRTFLTTATPGRGETHWRRLPGTACWTGGGETAARRLLDAAGRFPELEARALSVTRELLTLRPVAPPGEGAELEHSTALAAALGLGALAWILWHTRETVHPLLALERFANLDGTARTTADAIEVRPAFGRRYLDLQKHGLLAEIPAPPWLSGRRIVFVGP